MARSRSRMRPKTVAHTFAPHPGPREPVLAHREGLPLLRMQTLGAARLQLGYHQLGLQAGMLFPLVLRLVYTPGLAVPRETLLRELWPRHEDERRRGNLRQLLYKLRTMGLNVSMEGEKVQLDRDQLLPMFCVDRTIPLFERDIIRGVEPLGPFVPGFVPASDELEEWLDQTRASVHADVRRVLVEQLRGRRERADWSGAEVISRWLLPFDPLNEDATLTMAECAMLNGSKAEAVAILDRYLAELGPNAGDIRLPATQLRKRFTDPSAKRRPSLAITERHFVGRQQELADLTLALRRARWHDGSAILLHGPPGIGKTRVLTELCKVAQIEGYREVHLECRETDQRRPLGVFLDVIPELLGYPGALGCSPESLAVLRRLAPSDEDEQESHETSDGARSEGLRGVRSRTASLAIVELFAALSDERPIFLSLEDTHWLDRYSWDLLTLLVSRASSMRVFSLFTSRHSTGLEDPKTKVPYGLRVQRLPPLAADSARTLARAVSEDLVAKLTADVEEWVVGACEGTPLLLKALLEHWTATGEAGGVPPTLAALIEQRLDRLSSNALRTLQAAILLGRDASLERIRDCLQLPTADLILALEDLESHDCLESSDSALVVSHDLVSQVARKRLTPLIESALRSAIAESLEREFAKTDEPAVLLAALAQVEMSGNFDLLVHFLHRQETALVTCGRPHEVLAALSRIESDFPLSASDRRLPRVSARLESERGEFERSILTVSVLSPDFEYRESLTDVEFDEQLTLVEAAYRLDPMVDRRVLGSLAASISRNQSLRMELRTRAADIGLVIAANTCDPDLADACFSSLNLTSRDLMMGGSAQRLGVLYHAPFGDIEVARRLATSTFDRFSTLPPTTGTITEIGRAAFVFRLIGDVSRATEGFQRATEMAVDVGVPRLTEYPLWQLAQIELEAGNLGRASEHTQALLQVAAPANGTAANNYIESHLCLMALASGDLVEARRMLEAALQSLPKAAPLRSLAYTMGLSLAVDLADAAWTPSDALVEVATTRFKQTSMFCAADLLAAGVGEALQRRRRTREARALLKRYLSQDRREQSRPSSRLLRVLEMLGIQPT